MIDIKKLPVGSIAISDTNRFVVLAKYKNYFTVYSEKENITMKIKTKKLLINPLYKPNEILNMQETKISIFPKEFQSLVRKAVEKWLNNSNNYNELDRN